MGAGAELEGPDFGVGIDRAMLAEGATLAGRVGDEPVLLTRHGEAYFAVSGACTHYGGPLAQGLIAAGQVHCPWHHACFDLRTGEALAAPAFTPLKRWRVDVEGDRLVVRSPMDAPPPTPPRQQTSTRRIVIVGGGAAGFAAAEMLRRHGYDGALTILSADTDAPYDRPNLSKDYLAGTAPEEWMPLRDAGYYREHEIDLRLCASAEQLDTSARTVKTSSGETLAYDRLLLATGATPVRPPGYEHAHVHTLRSFTDARALIKAAQSAKHAVIVGAGFIGLETAASIRHRGLEVDVVAPETAPMIGLLGPDVSRAIQAVHERHGVRFHWERRAQAFDGATLALDNGERLQADLLVLGMGVRPNVELARQAGITVSNGVDVDAYLRTSDPNVFAAGDIARYPDPVNGDTARVEHWVAAQRQGQIAALNMLDTPTPFTVTPFFWSNHYDLHLRYTGQTSSWDRVEIDGDVAKADFTARYLQDGRVCAVVSAGRDRENLTVEASMNQARQEAAAALF